MANDETPFFKGKVFKHPAYVRIEHPAYTTAFKQYWGYGFSPSIGKDGILPVPDIYSKNAIGRAHVEPEVKTNKSKSSTEEAWFLWRTESDADVPTSNSFLIYCVAENRDCCLLAYLDGGEEDSHSIINNDKFRRDIQARADEFYRWKGTQSMDSSLHDSLFSESWMNESE